LILGDPDWDHIVKHPDLIDVLRGVECDVQKLGLSYTVGNVGVDCVFQGAFINLPDFVPVLHEGKTALFVFFQTVPDGANRVFISRVEKVVGVLGQLVGIVNFVLGGAGDYRDRVALGRVARVRVLIRGDLVCESVFVFECGG